jgi:hypothetical protein
VSQPEDDQTAQRKEMCELAAEELPELFAEGSRMDCGRVSMVKVSGDDVMVIVVVTVICVMVGEGSVCPAALE